jgi:hypothetical protein
MSRRRWVEHVVRIGVEERYCRVWIGKSEGKRSIGRHKRGWKDNVKMVLHGVGWAWTGLIWLRIGADGGHL